MKRIWWRSVFKNTHCRETWVRTKRYGCLYNRKYSIYNRSIRRNCRFSYALWECEVSDSTRNSVWKQDPSAPEGYRFYEESICLWGCLCDSTDCSAEKCHATGTKGAAGVRKYQVQKCRIKNVRKHRTKV